MNNTKTLAEVEPRYFEMIMGLNEAAYERIGELRDLWKNHPELWAELREIQTISRVTFKQDYTIFELEERFEKEQAKEETHETPG